MIEIAEKINCNVLLHPTNQRILGECMLKACTLKDLVEELHLDMSEAHYRVQQLTRAGILKVDREEKRAGRPIKYYIPTQEKFFLPFKDTPYNTLVDFMSQQLTPILQRFVELVFRNAPHLGEWGLGFEILSKDQKLATVFHQQRPDPSHPVNHEDLMFQQRVLGMWQILELTPETSREMKKELMDLYEKYRQKQSPDGEKHLYGVFLTPGDLQDT